jgi:hypothetical protein
MKYQFLSLSLNKIISWFILLTIVLTIPSCKDDPITPPKPEAKLELSVDDVSCTEAWLSVKIENLSLPLDIELMNDSLILKTYYSINSTDAVLYIDSLLPNKQYNFQVVNSSSEEKSNLASAVTLDTTSHNFTWQSWTFGTFDNSIFYDIAIINENNIWAVGDIKIADTSVNGYTIYNAVHWDGNEWKLHRIMFNTICGQQSQNAYPASSIIAFYENEIWIAQLGDQIAKIENGIQKEILCMPWIFAINKIWGTSSNDLYVVGSNGNIAHYNGSLWSKIASGTTLSLLDINGNGNGDIYVCGGNYSTGEGIVLKINSNKTVTKIIDSYYYGTGFDSTKMFTENLYGPLTGIWVNSNGITYSVGNLIYRYNLGMWGYAKGIENNDLYSGPFSGRGFSHSVRGKEINDFFFVGQRNTIRHFNGINATQIGEPFSYSSEYSWLAIDYKQNTAVAVGRKGGYAAVMVFKR